MWRSGFAALLWLGVSPVGAQSAPLTPVVGSIVDPTAFVNAAAQFASRGNYMGTLVYQRRGESETFRMVHINDNGVERERLTMLDGVPKELIREGDRTVTYLPDAKLIRVQPMNERAFPAMSSTQVQALLTHYVATDLGTERVAGHLARGLMFTPRDPMRYAQQWWMEVKSGLPIRARYYNERNELTEQVSFTDLQVETRVSRSHLRSVYASKAQDWKTEIVPAAGNVTAETGWIVRELPPGFIKVREGIRAMGAPGQPSQRVTHLLFSDGVATISVFIESAGANEPLGVTQQGSVNIYRKQIQESVVTALGETPPQTLKMIADAVSRTK
jgi:sigma-E factor negative regulatory protein RseB